MMQYQETLSSPRGFSLQNQSLLKVSCVPNIYFNNVKTGQFWFWWPIWLTHDEEEYPDKSALFGHVALLSCFLEAWGTLWQVMWKMVSHPKLTKP